jgi:hypothetical protein
MEFRSIMCVKPEAGRGVPRPGIEIPGLVGPIRIREKGKKKKRKNQANFRIGVF